MRVVVFVALLVGIVSGSIGIARQDEVRAQTETNPTVIAIQTQIAELEQQLTAIAEQPTGQSSPQANATIEYQGFTLTFTYAEKLTSLSGSDEMPRGIYILAHFTAINDGLEPESIPSDNFVLRDDRGRTFTLHYYSMGYLSFDYATLGSLQPGLEYDAVVAYDVPVDATGLTLVIEDAGFEYPLTFIE